MSDKYLEKYQTKVFTNQNYLTVLHKKQGRKNKIVKNQAPLIKKVWVKTF